MLSETVVTQHPYVSELKELKYILYSEISYKKSLVYVMCALHGDEALGRGGRFTRCNSTLPRENAIVVRRFEANLTWIHENLKGDWFYEFETNGAKLIKEIEPRTRFFFEDPEEAVLFKFNQPS